MCRPRMPSMFSSLHSLIYGRYYFHGVSEIPQIDSIVCFESIEVTTACIYFETVNIYTIQVMIGHSVKFGT